MTGEARGLNPRPASDLDPDHTFQRMMDGWKHIENFIHCIDIPTISAVNGPGVHTEFAVLCDITLSAPDGNFMDPHFWLGSPPGDGQGMALQAIMGHKRAAYHILNAESISAPKALEYGLVNAIHPRGELNDKAWELARFIAKRPCYVRWAAHNILSRPWKKLIAEDFGFHMAHQMLANIGSKMIVPDPDLLSDRPIPF